MPETNVGGSKSSSLVSYIGGSLVVVLFFAATFLLRQSGPTRSKPTRSKEPIPAADTRTEFTSGGDVLRFAQNCFYLTSGSQTLRVEFVNAHPIVPQRPPGPGIIHRGVVVSTVVYSNLWDGVTLTYDLMTPATGRSTYRLEPEAKVENIRLHYDLPLARQSDDSVRVVFRSAFLKQSALKAWQESDGDRSSVEVAFGQSGEYDIGFTIGQYDRSSPLFIRFTLDLEHTSQPE